MKRLILLSFFLSAPALAGPLADAQQKLEDMEYEEALRLAEQVLKSPGAEPSDLVDAYRIKGLCLSSDGRTDEALLAFKRALSIDSHMELSADTSPKLSAPFYQAQAMLKGAEPIQLVHPDPGPRVGAADRQVAVSLKADHLKLVRGIHLCQRIGQETWRCGSTHKVDGPGDFSFDLQAAPGDSQLTYYFEALNAHGGVLHRAGSREKPYGQAPAAVAADIQPPPLDLPEDPGDDLKEAPAGAPWFEQWWIWTAVGVVVVGTAVGLGVGLSAGDSGPTSYRISVE